MFKSQPLLDVQDYSMTFVPKPLSKPKKTHFSSGPCAKPPRWNTNWLAGALVGRSHRSEVGKQKLYSLIVSLKLLLNLPKTYELAIVPGSDTGAFEMAMWTLLGQRGVDVLAWEVFGKNWVQDVVQELRLSDVRTLETDFGSLPDLSQVDFSRDVVFTANGTTSGVRIPDFEWIDPHRTGLIFCDATSFILSHPIDWDHIDVATFSWQKSLGGEAAHGVLILSPRVIERVKLYRPIWPVPKLFRFAQDGHLDLALFQGQTLNTPSLLCVEDCLCSLKWAESLGGQDALLARANKNAHILFDWVQRTSWIENLAKDPQTWSFSSVCLQMTDKKIASLSEKEHREFLGKMAALLEQEKVAFDILGHRGAPPSLRIWCGPTVEDEDLQALTPWLEWAYSETHQRTFALQKLNRA